MNTFNRIVLVVLLLVTMVVCTLLLVAPVPALSAVARQAEVIVDLLGQFQWYVLVPVGIVCALILDAILIFVIVLEVRRPSRGSIRVEKTEGGEVQISVDSIADRLHYEVDQLPGVLDIKPKVSGKRGGVVVELEVETSAKINVPEKSAQILDAARIAVEEKMGLKLAQPPKVSLRAMPRSKTSKSSGWRKTKREPEAEPAEKWPVEPAEPSSASSEASDDSGVVTS